MSTMISKLGQRLLVLAVGMFFANASFCQIDRVTVTPTCGNECNGKITIRIKPDVAVPLHITLIDGQKKLQEKAGIKTREVEFLNVCPGGYTILVKSETPISCNEKDWKGNVPSLDLQVVLKEPV